MRLFTILCAMSALSLAGLTTVHAKDAKSADKSSLAQRIKLLEKKSLRETDKKTKSGVVLDKDCDVPFVTNGSLTIFGIKTCTTPPTQADLDREEEFGGR